MVVEVDNIIMAIVVQQYTTSELNTILGQLSSTIADYGNEDYECLQFGFPSKVKNYVTKSKMLRAAYELISSYNQSANGDPTNYTNCITPTELTATIMWVKQNLSC